MRFLKAAVLAFAGFTLATPVPMEDEMIERSEEVAERAIEKRANPSVSGLKFNIDGVTQYFAGTNSYWIGFLTNNADVDTVFTHLKSSGLKVLRVWGFNDVTQSTSGVWYQSFISGQQPQINTGTNGLQRLDYVVSSAESHGIKLIINFVNNWSDYGGMPAYNTFYGTTKTTWYTDSRVQTQYKAYISAVVSRYKSSSAIFAWELANEPRCNGCAPSVITQWATTISAYIKSLDSTHMVTLGDEGFMNGGGDGSYPYTTGEGVDFAANLKVPNLDFGVFHLYPDSWGVSDDWGNGWITNHGAACAAAGKPCILEEYGVTSNKVSIEGPWQKTALATNGIAGDMFWQWGDSLSSGQTADDGNTIYYGSSDFATLVTAHVAAIPGGSGTSTGGSGTTSAAGTTPTGGSTGSTGNLAKYSQCGGLTWAGSGTCVAGTTCTYSSDYYSQCL